MPPHSKYEFSNTGKRSDRRKRRSTTPHKPGQLGSQSCKKQSINCRIDSDNLMALNH